MMGQRIAPSLPAPVPIDPEQRQILHWLNQRYRSEFDRAESLRAELADIKNSRAWRVLAWLRHWRRRLWPSHLRSSHRSTIHSSQQLTDIPATGTGRVSVIIPFRDQFELLRPCLQSLERSDPPPHEIILVDNSSRDPDVLAFLQRWETVPGQTVVRCPGPFNFARICNVGARRARGDFLLFLNNDTEVLSPDWLEQMVRVAAHPSVGVVGATLLYPDGTIQHAGMFHEAGEWIHAHRGLLLDAPTADPELRQIRTVPAVTGACLLVGRELFWQLEGFDKRFPTAYNDVDLCRRIRERGLVVAVTPDAQLLHYESLSRGYAVERLPA